MILKEFSNIRVLVLGLGKEGIDTLKFLRKLFPKKIIGAADINKKIKKAIPSAISRRNGIKWHLGKNYLKALKNYDLIIKSPGIPIHLPEIERAQKKGKITSQTEIFFENCPSKIIGITGTKGKGTVSSLIYQILKACPGRSGKIHLVGNIGNPALSFLLKASAKDIFVYELSSHQLTNFKKSPQIAVFLNIFPAHLDYYKNFKEYLRAKENIALYQKKDDIFIYPKNLSPLLEKISKKTKAKKISFSIKDKKADCYIKNGYIFLKNEKIFKIKYSPLKGDFNLLNIMPGVIVAGLFNVSAKKISNVIKNFKTLPYRLEFIGNYSGIQFYNDSLATIPEATISAIKALDKNLQTIILGGFDSGLNYKNLAKEILKSRIKNLILFPTTGKKIWKEIIKHNLFSKKQQGGEVLKYFFTDNMKKAVKLAFEHTKKGKICLLSPAAPSFGVFHDYKERGDLFKKYTKNL